ncbi:MAG: response regulator, partial [Bdellovibrionota bacterium]
MERVKILLVDDRRENLFSLGSLLGELEVEIFKAQSGAEALALMVDHDFALALLDVQMPDMDGFELAELMRGTERTRAIPIIFITAASPASGFAFKGYESGAVDFLFKPVDMAVLKSKVKVFIELDSQKKQLLAAKEEAETANQLKSSFLANMSHEIRTPLGALVGFAELLDDTSTPPSEKSRYIQIIKKNGKALVELIDEILDLSKVEAGHLEIEQREFSPLDLVRDICLLLGKKAEQKGIYLEHKVDKAVPKTIISDSKRIRQILMNVVGNAIKFTEKGGVTLHLNAESRGSKSINLIFRVEDTGIGLKADAAKKLFKPFMQADNSVTRKFGGTGLGLALSRRLARLLGGDLTLAEGSEKGCTFVATITAEIGKGINSKNDSSQDEIFQGANLAGAKILLIEDSPDNQDLIKLFLEKRGASVELADNGQD